MWCIYIQWNITQPLKKHNEIRPFEATWMDPEIIILSQKDKYHTISLNTWNLKYDTNEPIYKTKTDSDVENRLVVAKGGDGVGEKKVGSLGLAGANYYI